MICTCSQGSQEIIDPHIEEISVLCREDINRNTLKVLK